VDREVNSRHARFYVTESGSSAAVWGCPTCTDGYVPLDYSYPTLDAFGSAGYVLGLLGDYGMVKDTSTVSKVSTVAFHDGTVVTKKTVTVTVEAGEVFSEDGPFTFTFEELITEGGRSLGPVTGWWEWDSVCLDWHRGMRHNFKGDGTLMPWIEGDSTILSQFLVCVGFHLTRPEWDMDTRTVRRKPFKYGDYLLGKNYGPMPGRYFYRRLNEEMDEPPYNPEDEDAGMPDLVPAPIAHGNGALRIRTPASEEEMGNTVDDEAIAEVVALNEAV